MGGILMIHHRAQSCIRLPHGKERSHHNVDTRWLVSLINDPAAALRISEVLF